MDNRVIMESLLSTEQRWKFQEELLQERLDNEKTIWEKFNGKNKFSLQDLYKEQRDFIVDFTKRMNTALDGVIGQAELQWELESDLQEHRNAINTDMMQDFEKPFSDHDLLRKKMQYIKHFLAIPVKVIEQAQKDEVAKWMVTPIEEEVNTPAEDTTFTG